MPFEVTPLNKTLVTSLAREVFLSSVSRLMPFNARLERKCLAACFTRERFLTGVAQMMPLQQSHMSETLPTGFAYERFLTVVGAHVTDDITFETELLGTDKTTEGSFIRMSAAKVSSQCVSAAEFRGTFFAEECALCGLNERLYV